MSGTVLPRSGALGGTHLRVASDVRLARLVAAGDERAFAAIYRRHQAPLFRYCLSIVRNEHDAHDVLQAVMTNALVALRRETPDAPLRPWLFRIAHNEAISALRRRKPTAELGADLAGPDIEVTIEERRRLRLLVDDLQALPERQRGALVMRELSGLSHVEIAAALEITPAKAKQTILEARLSLQESERGRAMDCGEVRALISERDGRRLRARTVRAHLRGCEDCRTLRDAIHRREADLALLAPPLPGVAAAALLAQLIGGGGGGSLVAKVATGAAIVATTAGAGAGVSQIVRDEPRRPAVERVQPSAADRPRVAPPTVPATNPASPPASGSTPVPTPSPSRSRGGTRGGRKKDRPAPAPVPSVAPSPTPEPAATPQTTPKPVRPPKPVRTPKPEKTPRPVRTPKPEKTPKPVRTPKPEKTPKPVRTPKPRPTRTPAPVRTPKPTRTPKPPRK